MIAHLVNRVNGLHDPVLQELEVTELDRIVHAVVLQVLVAQTHPCSGQVANPNSLVPAWLELQLVVLKLTVKAKVPATVCWSMSEILHSPVAKVNVTDLDKHWEHKGWSAPSHALSKASIITFQQEATSASGWFLWVRLFGRLAPVGLSYQWLWGEALKAEHERTGSGSLAALSIGSAGECLLTLKACLTQNEFSRFHIFSRIETSVNTLDYLSWVLNLGIRRKKDKKESIFTGQQCYKTFWPKVLCWTMYIILLGRTHRQGIILVFLFTSKLYQ